MKPEQVEFILMDLLKQRPMTPKEILEAEPRIHPRTARTVLRNLRECGNVYRIPGTHLRALVDV